MHRMMMGREAGIIAFRRTGHPSLGDFDDAVILGRYDETPDDPTSFTMRGVGKRSPAMVEDVFTHQLPNDLLIEIGRIAVACGAIEQALNYFLLPAHSHWHGHQDVPKISWSFSERRNAWYRLCRDRYEETSIRGIESLNQRLVNMAAVRAFVLHGCWQDVRHDTVGNLWGKRFSSLILGSKQRGRELSGNAAACYRLARRDPKAVRDRFIANRVRAISAKRSATSWASSRLVCGISRTGSQRERRTAAGKHLGSAEGIVPARIERRQRG